MGKESIMRRRRDSDSAADRRKKTPGRIAVIIFLILFTIFEILPIYYILVSSFKTQMESLLSPLGLPIPFHIANYVQAIQDMHYFNALKNNFLITACTVAAIVILASLAAYPLARCRIRINSVIFTFFLAGLMIPGQMLLFPLFKMMAGLGLVNTLPSVMICLIAGGIPFAVFLFTGFVRTIPYELEESAYIDGCGPFGTFWRILLPLLKPVLATVIILDSLSSWNEFLTPLMFLQSRDNSVLLLEVYRNVGRWSVDFFGMMPMLVLAVLPVLLFYLFMQRYIIKGVVSGSLKG